MPYFWPQQQQLLSLESVADVSDALDLQTLGVSFEDLTAHLDGLDFAYLTSVSYTHLTLPTILRV